MILIYEIVLFGDILLTWATHKITSFLDFYPFLQGFQSVDTYIKTLMIDIANLTYFEKLVAPYHNVPSIFVSNWSVKRFLMSLGYADHPYACRSKLKFDQLNLEIQYACTI